MRINSFQLSTLFLVLCPVAIGCSSPTGGVIAGSGGSGGQSGPEPNGGEMSAGGTIGSGGALGTGGAMGTGGATSTGGTTSPGGATSTGGSKATGGTTGVGGSTVLGTGGTKASGGTTSSSSTAAGTGGAAASGGTVGTGGAKAAGGATSTGGSKNGGTLGAGGTGATGGVVGPGGSTGASTATIPGNGCTPPAAYANLFVSLSGHTQAETDAKLAAGWAKLFNPKGSGNIYFDGPASDESYVEDIGNNDARTEGMSYGMMIAVQLDHQTEFDRLWTFTKKHMIKGSGAISEITWSVATSGGSNGKSGGAPDGDEYYATALIFAHNRWGDTTGKYNYKTEAQSVLDLVRTKDFDASHHLVLFYSGSGNTDPSYILPAFYQTWACFDTANKTFWESAVTAGRSFFHGAIDANGVMGDKTSFTGQVTTAAGPDTIRCVANIMMDHNFFNVDAWQTETYAPKYGAYMKTQNPYTAQLSCNSLLGFGLPASDGKSFVDKLWSAGIPSGNYWDGVLYMLALLHVSGTFHLWY